ncbi:hypothetical protein N9K98_07230 [Luminiphilus sp.]|nr:hypothetical protein [Luminiphilus sp.]
MSGFWLTKSTSGLDCRYSSGADYPVRRDQQCAVSPWELGLLFIPLAPAALSAVWPTFVWNNWFLYISVALLGLAPTYFILSALSVAARHDKYEASLMRRLLGVYLIAGCLCAFCFLLVPIPMFGWDALDQWGRQASNFISAVESGEMYQFEYIHPDTGYFVSIFESRASTELGFDVSGACLASAYYTILASGSRLCMLRFNLTPLLSLSVACAIWSTPGVVNGIVIYGYVDFWLAYCIFLFFYFFHLTSTRMPALCLIGMLLAICLPAALKDSGFLISVSGFASFLTLFAARLISKNWALPAVAALLSVFLPVLILLEVVIDLRGLNVPFRVDFERGLINVGSRGEKILWSDASQVISSLAHAFFVNQTYSVTFFAGFFAFLWGLCFGKRDYFSEVLTLFFILLSLYLIAPLFMSSYFMSHSLPTNDTALSRFSIYYMPVIYFLIIRLLAALSGPRVISAAGEHS